MIGTSEVRDPCEEPFARVEVVGPVTRETARLHMQRWHGWGDIASKRDPDLAAYAIHYIEHTEHSTPGFPAHTHERDD